MQRFTARERGMVWRLCIWLASLGLSLAPAPAQEKKTPAERGAQLLPPSLGEPYTVVPLDMPDVECQILEWSKQADIAGGPTLTLLCPPEPVFAPLRVLIKLCWIEEEGREPLFDPEDIRIEPGENTRLRTRADRAFVRLDLLDAKGKPRRRWVPFTAVADVALLSRYPKRTR